jgi:hypothetical protein
LVSSYLDYICDFYILLKFETRMAEQGKYLNEKEISEILGVFELDAQFVPMSQDTYNEKMIIDAIAKTKRVAELCEAAINLSCMGYGNQRYGNFRVKEKIIDIQNLLTDTGVKIRQPKDAKLKDNDLTPQRLCRAFRYQIREYIHKHRFETYLFRKYSNHDPNYAHLLFRGSEYLDDLKPDEVHHILDAYVALDRAKSSEIAKRIQRVFQAKGYLKRDLPEQF